MAVVLPGQRPQEEAIVPVMLLALLAALVGAAAAGRAVAGGAAGLVGTSPRCRVASGAHASESCADHGDAAVAEGRGRLGLDVQVLVTGGEVEV